MLVEDRPFHTPVLIRAVAHDFGLGFYGSSRFVPVGEVDGSCPCPVHESKCINPRITHNGESITAQTDR